MIYELAGLLLATVLAVVVRTNRGLIESTAEGVLSPTRVNINAVNRATSEITGYSEAEALGKTPHLLASGLHDSAFYAAMWYQLTAEGHWQGEICNRSEER
ncbi:PAS domain S-box-containing protein [Pseudomonas sp. LP_7_YM]|nr:PAS domain S-box-containing protein [Pseudomonas sp. LP_7_YM]